MEFGVGALLALAAPAAARLPAAARNLLAGGGLLAIAVACFVVTEATPFPGYAALLPVLGTGAVMVAGAGVTGRPPTVQRALGVAPLRLVGDMSYSLYLWHWPMLTIAAAYAGRDLRLTETAVVLGLCVALSWATYRWVETPFRTYAPRRLSRTLVLYPVSLAVVLAGSGVATAWVGDGVDTRGDAITTREWDRAPGDRPLSDDETVALVQASVVAARQGAEIPRRLDPPLVDLAAQRAAVGTCDYEDAPPWTLCRRGDVGADRSIVVLGNSHGRHWIPAVERIAQQEGFETHYLTKQACTPARVQSISRDSERPWRECTQFNAWAQEQVERLEPDIVIAVGSAPRGLFVDGELVKDTDERTEEMGRGFSRLIADLEPHAGEVVILGDVPRRDDQPGECLGRPRASLARCLATPDARAAGVVEVSREATVGTTARFIDTEPWFCADGRCPAVVGDMITMRDQGHVTNVYSAHLADALARRWGCAAGAESASSRPGCAGFRRRVGPDAHVSGVESARMRRSVGDPGRRAAPGLGETGEQHRCQLVAPVAVQVLASYDDEHPAVDVLEMAPTTAVVLLLLGRGVPLDPVVLHGEAERGAREVEPAEQPPVLAHLDLWLQEAEPELDALHPQHGLRWRLGARVDERCHGAEGAHPPHPAVAVHPATQLVEVEAPEARDGVHRGQRHARVADAPQVVGGAQGRGDPDAVGHGDVLGAQVALAAVREAPLEPAVTRGSEDGDRPQLDVLPGREGHLGAQQPAGVAVADDAVRGDDQPQRLRAQQQRVPGLGGQVDAGHGAPERPGSAQAGQLAGADAAGEGLRAGEGLVTRQREAGGEEGGGGWCRHAARLPAVRPVVPMNLGAVENLRTRADSASSRCASGPTSAPDSDRAHPGRLGVSRRRGGRGPCGGPAGARRRRCCRTPGARGSGGRSPRRAGRAAAGRRR